MDLFALLIRDPEGVDQQHAQAEDGAQPEVDHGVYIEDEAGDQCHYGVAEGAPGTGLSVFEAELAGVTFGDGFNQ